MTSETTQTTASETTQTTASEAAGSEATQTARETYTAAVVGASGYAGGELCRLLADHPQFTLTAATSRQYTGRSLGTVHPTLRDLSVRFSSPDELPSVDVLFAATPHGVSMERIDAFRAAADLVVDLSADFRLPVETYEAWYEPHAAPEHVARAAYALPELNRDAIREASLLAVGGCNATATILALAPLVEAGLIDPDDRVVVDVKVGSSEGGAGGGRASSHPERSGVVRPYAPTGHRHEAEIAETLGVSPAFTAHAVDTTRAAAATCHAFPSDDASDTTTTTDAGVAEESGDTNSPLPPDERAQAVAKRDLWAAYREAYADEPFVELVAGGSGVHRYPEPKLLAGTNRAAVGFEPAGDRIVAFAAIDNLGKGAAGQAVQAANCALGLPETTGLERRGLHPVGAP